MRRFSRLVLTLTMVFAVLRPALAAPMFPDVPDMWAKDAVAALAAKGILEGYPDGTFKGDRAATRYEVAMIVARLLAKMEQEHATFASRADLDELRRLVTQLKDELDALGIRVTNLEDSTARLDKRISELERVTFYGSLYVSFTSMRMRNTGLAEGTNGNQTAPPVAYPGGVPFNQGGGGPFPPAGIVTQSPTNATSDLVGFTIPGGGVFLLNPLGPGQTPPAGFIAVPGTTGPTAPVPGAPSVSVALTGVGVPAAFISGAPTGLPAALAGRPVYINELFPNSASFNTDNNAPVARPSYNLVVGSNRSLGGNVYSAPSGIATGGNPFTGLTGFVGVATAVPLVLPTFEYRTGRPWTQGTGFSGQGILGVRIKLNDEMDSGLEFASYYSAGDPIVDAFYGVSAVRMANVFASNSALSASTGANAGLALDAGQGAANSPWSRMVIDDFWLYHKPSGVKLQLGSYGTSTMDPIVYVPEYNPNPYGPRYLDNYGFRLSGRHHFLAPFEWEMFGSAVPDGNRLATNFPTATALGATPYKPYLWGADGRWLFGNEGNQMRVKFNLLRVWDDNAAGMASTVGSIVGVNGVWLDWANPNGYYAAQLSPQYNLNPTGTTINPNASKVAGIGSTSDVRPIIPNIAGNGGGFTPTGANANPVLGIDTTGSGMLGAQSLPLILNINQTLGGLTPAQVAAQSLLPTSSFGPQSMFTWGASTGWDRTWTDNVKTRFVAEYAHSDYKPSAASPYIAPPGTAFRVGLGFTFFKDLDFDTEYLSVNPYYNPYVMQYPAVNGVTNAYWRLPTMSWFPEMFPVSDKDAFPNNRTGFRLNLKWSPVDPKDGAHKTVLYAEYGNMTQDQTSLQQIRFSPGSIAIGALLAGTGTAGVPALFDPNGTIPNGFVLGQNPGFIDTVFTGFHPSSFAGFTGSLSPSAVNQFATPLENPTGRVTNWGLGLNYRFDSFGGLGVHAGYKNWQFTRPSSLGPQFGGSENNINLNNSGGLVALSYPVTDRVQVKAGYSWVSVKGHYDPSGLYRNFALDTGNINFQTQNTDQTSPYVGFDFDVARNVSWGATAKWLSTHDNLGTFSTPTFFLQRNPFSWSGFMLNSQLKVSF